MNAVGEQVIKGYVASEGLALGEIFVVIERSLVEREVGDPKTESTTFKQSLKIARAQLDALAEKQDENGAEILEFQTMLLEDEDLLAPVIAEIKGGVAAHLAWAKHLDQEIAEYRSADDEYMAARGEDLYDLKLRVNNILAGQGNTIAEEIPAGAILVFDQLAPSQFLSIDWGNLGGAASTGGSRTSHVSILARAASIPLIVGLETANTSVLSGICALLDAQRGELVLNPDEASKTQSQKRVGQLRDLKQQAAIALSKPALTRSGGAVSCMINVDDPAALDAFDMNHCDGIGLTRTEFLFRDGHHPDEEKQLSAYRKLLEWAQGRPVTIRTLDAGGDKPIKGITIDGETNPFLGVRGLRLSLSRPEIFRVQLRALARAAAHGQLKVMVPMVTIPLEMLQFRQLMQEVVAELSSAGVKCAMPELGMMVEVPAAAIMADKFEADFYSIGSNDLVQYVTASARDNPALTQLADPHNPAVLALIEGVVEAAKNRDVEVSICGEMASAPESIAKLLSLGIRSLSVTPARLGSIKLAITNV